MGLGLAIVYSLLVVGLRHTRRSAGLVLRKFMPDPVRNEVLPTASS